MVPMEYTPWFIAPVHSMVLLKILYRSGNGKILRCHDKRYSIKDAMSIKMRFLHLIMELLP